jgi:hypothetical protein
MREMRNTEPINQNGSDHVSDVGLDGRIGCDTELDHKARFES